LAGIGDSPRKHWIDFRRSLNYGRGGAKAIAESLQLNDSNRLCVLIDQFEELLHNFRDTESDQAKLLAEFLVRFSESPPDGLFVLVTMRSEFLGLCSRFPGLAEAINRSQYLLPRMDTENLLRAIREPALLYGGMVTERLAERLIVDARGSEDELPLVQHGLSQLWSTRPIDQADVLDIGAYPSGRALSLLISDHADDVMEAAVGKDPAGVKIVEEFFRALTAINSDGHAIRRPQHFRELLDVTGASEVRLRSILDAFRRPGVSFVTPYPPTDIEPDTLIDISHEALIRHWKKISDPQVGWLQREFRDGLIWQSLRVQTEAFLSNRRNLLTEATTDARSTWLKNRNRAWAARYGGMWSDVEKLIDASRKEIEHQKQHDKEQKEEAERLRVQAERGARIRNYMLVAICVAAATTLLTVLAAVGWNRAVYQSNQADIARKTALTAQGRAEAEKMNAENAKNEAVSARQRAEEQWQRAESEKSKAEAARAEAVEERARAETAEKEAVTAKNGAEEEARKAKSERAAAEMARQQEKEAREQAEWALQTRDSERNRASKLQEESASSYLAIHGESKETLRNALLSLEKETNPFEVAKLGQVVGQLSSLASANEIQSAMQILIRDLERAQDPTSAGAIAQALSGLATNLSQEQAQLESDTLLRNLPRDISERRSKAIALAFAAMAPRINSKTSSQMEDFLVRELKSAKDPDVVGTIAVALSSLKWAPTQQVAEELIDSVASALTSTTDPVQIGNIATLIVTMAPTLPRQAAQRTLDTIHGLKIQSFDALKPAQAALIARAEQPLSTGFLASSETAGLLQKISAGRWCTPSRSYSLQLNGDTAVWRDNLGSVDTEKIIANSASEAQTITQRSVHSDGNSETAGTIWTYHLNNTGSVSARSNNKKAFSLKRC
jgi:hypothetical protein